MTFCLGMKVADGLVGLADTRITSGAETITGRKLVTKQIEHGTLFLMTSGLRSVRDKVVTYFDEALQADGGRFDKLYKAVNAYAQQVRAVAAEDKEALRSSKLHFNLYTLIGGQCAGDAEPKLYMLYPEANWVEVSMGTPYAIIGETGYGKPLLDRMLRYESGMDLALKIGYLAFDATRTSSSNVGLPLDVIAYRNGSFSLVEHRFDEGDLEYVSAWWQHKLGALVDEIPSDWIKQVFGPTQGPKVVPLHPQ